MSKYTFEEKLEAVLRVENEGMTLHESGMVIGCKKAEVLKWRNLYREHGPEALLNGGASYDGEFKVTVGVSMRSTMDIDASIKNENLQEEDILRVITDIVNWCNANGLGDSIYTLETQLRYAYEVFIPGSWHFAQYTGAHAYPTQYNISYEQWLALEDKDIDLATGAFCACSEKPYYRASYDAGSRLESTRIPYAEYLARIKAGTLGGSMAYVAYAVSIANDDSHGYDQQHRDGNPDYDCSSLVSYSLRAAGYPVNVFDTSCEGSELTGVGFQRLPYNAANLRAGDILWRPGHTEIYIGNGQNVGAHCNEFGGIMFGKPGDQTGREINVSNNSSLWEYIYRVPDAPAAD